MNLTLWNPARELEQRLFVGRPAANGGEWLPLVDVCETADAYRLDVEVPALAPADVEVSFREGVLSIAGERKCERGEGETVHRSERRFGRFCRGFRLPDDADEAGIAAAARDGVLEVTVPKRAAARTRQIEVKASR